MTAFADIEPAEAEWLWKNYLPAGETTVVAGAGGIGKSFWVADMAARVSNGQPMPDGSEGGPAGSVILVSAEDDAASTTVYRLKASGADLGMVHDLSEVDRQPFTVPDHLPQLRQLIAELGDCRMVVLDPASAVSSVPLSTGPVNLRKKFLTPLRQLARDTGVSVILIHHLVKSGDIAGSKCMVDGVRSVLTIERDEADARLRLLKLHKGNLAKDTTSPVRYGLNGEGDDAHVVYAAQLEDPVRPGSGTAGVLSLLRLGGPMGAHEVAQRTGTPYFSIKVALARLVKRGEITRDNGIYTASSPAAPLTSVNP